MMDLKFATSYEAILQKMDQIDPLAYGSTRNYIDGAVTYLSPYISRGVISTRQVLQAVLDKGYKIEQMESFVKELCWRDYFQRVAQEKDLDAPLRQAQAQVSNHGIPSQVTSAATGIDAIDTAVNLLYQHGYMHNHCRMYTASLVCNVAKSNWHHPAQWMYYHLLDGDWASNACSWQWVAGANSVKKYYANQENINKYTYTDQVNTYLDTSYEVIETMETPLSLSETHLFSLPHHLPDTSGIVHDPKLPTFIYNYYNLDPLWHKDEPGNRILLIEPAFFIKYPVSKKCMDFMLALSQNITGIQVYTGSFKSFVDQHQAENIHYKEHPLNTGYFGTKDERDWITQKVYGYYPSFFSYWKEVKKYLQHK